MQSNYFPRVETIVVPADVRAEYVGLYVSHRAAEILADVGLAGYNHKTVSIRPTNDLRIFHLMFDGFRPQLTAEVRSRMFVPNAKEPNVESDKSSQASLDGATKSGVSGPMCQDELLAARAQVRSRKNNQTA